MGTTDGLIVETQLVLCASSYVDSCCFLQPKHYHKNFALLEVFKACIRWVYLLSLKQFVDSALMKDFVPDCLLADFAGEWLVVIINAMRSLYLVGLAYHPVFQALEMDALDAACTSANTE